MNLKTIELVSCGTNPRTGRPRVIISTDSVDAMNDRITQAGLMITPPVPMFLNHAWQQMPIAQIPNEGSIYRAPHRTEAEFDFFQGDAEIDRVANLYRQGAFGASVGFQVLESRPNEFGGSDILRSRLHEVSLTAIPANRECVSLVRSLLSRTQPEEPVLYLRDDEPPTRPWRSWESVAKPVLLIADDAEGVLELAHEDETVHVDLGDLARAFVDVVDAEVRSALGKATGNADYSPSRPVGRGRR